MTRLNIRLQTTGYSIILWTDQQAGEEYAGIFCFREI
jgi:hypothetical protein